MKLLHDLKELVNLTSRKNKERNYANGNSESNANIDLALVRSIVCGMEMTGNPQSVKDLKEVLGDISLENNHLLGEIIQEMTPWIVDNAMIKPDVIINFEIGMVNCHVEKQTIAGQFI